MTVRFVLNGKDVEIEDADPQATLLAWLRGQGLTGSKEGCAEGECGACAVAVLREEPEGTGSRYEPINACLVPLAAVSGRSVVTVEGVARKSGELHPVQKGMVARGGSQCGYCTPGFVVSLFCEYHRPGRTASDVESISGNLCRCTGYRPILDVLHDLPAPAPDDEHGARLHEVRLPLARAEHDGAGRKYVRPADLPELFSILADEANATLIAGGTDLMVYANQRHVRWPLLVSLDAIPELRRFEVRPDEIVIGAMVPLSEVEDRLAQGGSPGTAALEQLLPLFSSRLIRNRATLGGNLGTASPIGDSPPVLLSLEAELTLLSAKGHRRLPLSDFFVGYRKTALAHGEIIGSVHLPRPLPAVQRFYKVSKRVLDDISTVAGAFALDLHDDGRVRRLRAAYGGVAATPLRAYAVEERACGKPWSAETLALLLRELDGFGTPMTDHRGTGDYRRAMIGKLLEKFCAETAFRAEAAE
jgi:xanthine dehydrogenase small subunit